MSGRSQRADSSGGSIHFGNGRFMSDWIIFNLLRGHASEDRGGEDVYLQTSRCRSRSGTPAAGGGAAEIAYMKALRRSGSRFLESREFSRCCSCMKLQSHRKGLWNLQHYYFLSHKRVFTFGILGVKSDLSFLFVSLRSFFFRHLSFTASANFYTLCQVTVTNFKGFYVTEEEN